MLIDKYFPLNAAEETLIHCLRSKPNHPVNINKLFFLKDPDSSTTIRSDVIRSLILNDFDDIPHSNERFQVNGATIIGELSLSSVVINKNISFSNCIFKEKIKLQRSELKNLFIVDCDLFKGLDADGASISGDIYLTNTVSHDQVSMMSVNIGGILECNNTKFLSEGNSFSADRAEVKGGVFIRNATSQGAIVFSGARLGGDLSAQNLRINGSLYYQKELYSLIADKIEVAGDIFLDGIVANGEVRLVGAKVGHDLALHGATLNGNIRSLNCNGITVEGAWFWRNGSYSRGAIDLTGAKIGIISDEADSWPSEILLDRCSYGSFAGEHTPTDARSRINWLSRLRPREAQKNFWPQPFEECARVLRESGDIEGARLILIEKEKIQRRSRRIDLTSELKSEKFSSYKIHVFLKLIWTKFADFIVGSVISYGYNPLGSIIPLLYFSFIGAYVFLAADYYDAIKPNLPEIQKSPEWVECGTLKSAGKEKARANFGESQIDCYLRQPEAQSAPSFRPFIYSVNALLPVVSLETLTYWVPDERKSVIGSVARYYLWIHTFLGWILSLLAIAGFSGVVKTDSSK